MKHIKPFAGTQANEAKINEVFGEVCFLVAVLANGVVESSYSKVFHEFAKAQHYYLKQVKKRLGFDFEDYRKAKRFLAHNPDRNKFTLEISEIDVVR